MIFIDSACYQVEKMCEMLKSKLILIPISSAPKSLLDICMIEIPLLTSNNNIRFLTQHFEKLDQARASQGLINQRNASAQICKMSRSVTDIVGDQ